MAASYAKAKLEREASISERNELQQKMKRIAAKNIVE